MHKILIIDDERSIVKGLVKILENREELDLQIYHASTISEGVQIAKEVKLDILCTDITMPVMDGFEFSQRVRAYWKDCKIVYLTGYDTFDYIYKAVNQYRGKYMLKNEEEEKFVEVIQSCIQEIELEQQIKLEKSKMIEIEDENRNYHKHQIMTDFLRNNTSEQDMRLLKNIYDVMQINSDNNMHMALGKLLGEQYKKEVGQNHKKIIQVIKKVKEEYIYFYEVDSVKLYGNTYLIIMQSKTEEGKEPSLIHNMLEEIQTTLVEQYDEKISFIYSNKTISFKVLKEQLKLYTTLLDIKLLKHSPILIDVEEVITEKSVTPTSNQQYALQIDKMLIEKQFLDLKEIFVSLYISIKNTYELSLANTQMYYKCLEKVSEYIEKNINYLALPEDLQRSYYHLRYLTGIDEIHHFLVILLRYLEETKQHNVLKEEMLIVKKVEDYILNHITEEVTLNKLAKLVYFNPSYLSRFYKSVTGRNLSQFIKEAKLLRAKELLKESDKKIGDISKILGYECVGYFNVFFKKCVGLTPTEYRNNEQG